MVLKSKLSKNSTKNCNMKQLSFSSWSKLSFSVPDHRLKMFGSLLPKAPIPIFAGQSASTITVNPSNDFEVNAPPDDTVSAMRFSPATLPQTFLLAGSWDNSVRLWEVESSGKTVPKQMQTMGAPVLDVCWADVSYMTLSLMLSFFYLHLLLL